MLLCTSHLKVRLEMHLLRTNLQVKNIADRIWHKGQRNLRWLWKSSMLTNMQYTGIFFAKNQEYVANRQNLEVRMM